MRTLIIIILIGYFCSVIGFLNDKGLIIGTTNPASITTFTEIPKSSSSSFSNVTTKINPTKEIIFDLAADPKEGSVFAAIGHSIYIIHNFSSWQNVSEEFTKEIKRKSWGIGQIAFDFVSKNLYWCDALLDWIAMTPAYNDGETIYKVVVHKDLTHPVGLALDPEDRVMFFSNTGHNPLIEKASLDGQEREVIVHKGLLGYSFLTVDRVNNKLYWADYWRHTLEGCDYDGSNRKMIFHTNFVSVIGLTYHQNILHAVSWNAKSMFAVDISTGSVIYYRRLPNQPSAITVYDATSQGSFNNPCLTLNCQHLCVNTQFGPKCLCSEGLHIDSNGKTCSEKSWFFKRGFIVSNTSMFAMHEVHATSGDPSVHYISQFPSDNIGAFTVDATSDMLYFVDTGSNFLKKYDIISQQSSNITSLTSATDLIFDWIANLLGWIEPPLSSISSFALNSQTRDTIYTNLEQPAYLTADPHRGTLYWISGIGERAIVRGSWTRDMPTVLISAANLNDPMSLQYDVTSDRLYWLDHVVIKSAMTNGSDIKSHIITDGANKASVYKNFFGWIKGNWIHFANKAAESAEYILDTVIDSKEMTFFDSSLQQNRRGTCYILNGGCEEICVPEENGRRCECDIGLQLKPDNSCDSNVLSKNFIVVADYTHGRIMQIDLQTGTLVKLPLSINEVVAVAFDKSTKTLFYSEWSTFTIASTTLHGKNTTIMYATGFAYANSLAIDYSTGNLYYTASGISTPKDYIAAIHRFELLHKTLIHNLHQSACIALYPSKGYMFWTEYGNRTQIGRANMNGKSKTYIATTSLRIPSGITIDFTSNRLYWVDWKKNVIESSDFNGGHRLLVASDSNAYLQGIVNHGQFLYYTAWNRRRVTKMDKTTGLKVDFMPSHPELGRLDSIDIYADEFRDVSLSCSIKNGLCSTFCFPTPNGRTCGCPDNVDLQSDRLTCQGVFRCPTLQPNLNFIDCIPYPGLSCSFKCKDGYQLAANDTVFCDSFGKWSSQTSTLCEEIHSPIEACGQQMIYLYAGISVTLVIVLVVVISGVIYLKRRGVKLSRSPSQASFPNIQPNAFSTFENGYGQSESIHYSVLEDSVVTPYLTQQAN